MAEIVVGADWFSSDPEVYWFGVSFDGMPYEFDENTAVLVELRAGGGTWQAFSLSTAPHPTTELYAIRTIVPAAIANGQEREIRLTLDGVVYGPWSWRFYAPG